MVKRSGLATSNDDLVDATRLAVDGLLGVAQGARRASKSLRRFIEHVGGVDFGWHHRATLDHMEELMAYPPPVPSPRPWKPSPFMRVRVDDDGAHDYEPDGDTVPIFKDGARPPEPGPKTEIKPIKGPDWMPVPSNPRNALVARAAAAFPREDGVRAYSLGEGLARSWLREKQGESAEPYTSQYHHALPREQGDEEDGDGNE
jgi:hypothetical protein